MTYIADIDPNNPAMLAADEYRDFFDWAMPNWEVRESYGDRFIGEADFPVAPPVVAGPTVADWDAYREMTYVDPFELNY